MKNAYKTKFAIHYLRCLNCNYLYHTVTGDFDIEVDAITLAESLHDDFTERHTPKKCVNSRLIIEIKKILRSSKITMKLLKPLTLFIALTLAVCGLSLARKIPSEMELNK